MSWLFAAASWDGIQVVLAALGASGIVGSIIAWRKLRPDMNTAAVTQSQGAVETMAILQRELQGDRDAWRTRALTAENEARLLSLELERCKRGHGRRPRATP